MVTFQELHIRGAIAGFHETSCDWTLRVYETEILAAFIAPRSPSSSTLVLCNGHASKTTPQAPLVMRFQLVQHSEHPPRSWIIDCEARLDPGSAVVCGAWSYTPGWPLPSPWMRPTSHEFQLAITPQVDANTTGDVQSLRRLKVGRYAFQGVFVDQQARTAQPIVVELFIKDTEDLHGRMTINNEAPRSLNGAWGQGVSTWTDDYGLLMNAQIDNVLLLGGWSYNAGAAGWFELVMVSESRQWTWEDHASAPLSLQNAFAACQQLAFPGIDDDVWHQVFSCCDYDWFKR